MLRRLTAFNIPGEGDHQLIKSLIWGPRADGSQSSICSLIVEQFLAQGSAPALLTAAGETIHTYSTLLTYISDLSCFLKNKCQLQSPACVGILVDESCYSVVSTLATIFAGLTPTVLDVESPLKRLESICNEVGIHALIHSQPHSRNAQCLLWSCSRLSTIICINTGVEIDDGVNNRSMLALVDTQWWDAKVLYAADDDRIAGGWMNAYDGALFTHLEMSEFASNTFEHLRPLLCKHWRVLEIGSGSGYAARTIAPHVSHYVATDSSRQMTAYLRAKLDPQQWPMITFDTVSAENIGERFSPNSFNLIIMNSVVHCFPTHAFLTDVIHQCIRLLDPETGVIFIGDVMDLQKCDEMLDSVRAYQQANPLREVQLDLNHILFLPDIYFIQLCESIGADVNILPRIGTIDNELARYDYDVIISMASSELKKCSPISALSKVSYKNSDFIGQGSIDELIALSRTVSLDMGAYIANYHAVDHRALRNYVDWACRTFQMNATTVVPLFDFDLPFLVCSLASGGRVILFDSFERSHQIIADCDRLTLVRFTRQQLATVLDDARSPLSESTIVLVGRYENTDVFPLNRLIHHQTEKISTAIWNEYRVGECIDACLVKKISNNTQLSLGLPIQNTLIAIIDDQRCLVSPNCEARLCLGRDGLIFSTDVTLRYNPQTKEIFQSEFPPKNILNGRYIDLLEIESALECLPCVHRVWVTIFSDKKQDLIGAVFQVCEDCCSLQTYLLDGAIRELC